MLTIKKIFFKVVRKQTGFPDKPVILARVVPFFILLLVLFLACQKSGNPDAMDKDTSYAFGMLMAMQMNQQGMKDLLYDYAAFMEGFKDVNENKETRLTQDEAFEKINEIYVQVMSRTDEKQTLEAEKNIEEGKAFMETNAARSGVITTASGLQYEVITQGRGAKPNPEDSVLVHYEGALINGDVFDSTYPSGQPIDFPLEVVIPGWREGVLLMTEGSTYRFVIPQELGYGKNAVRSIPAGSTLVFKVELISIIKQEM